MFAKQISRLILLAVFAGNAAAAEKMPWPVVPEPGTAGIDTGIQIETGAIDPTLTAKSQAIVSRISDVPMGDSDEDKADDEAIAAFYQTHPGEFLWVDETGLNSRALGVIAELRNASAWGLDADAFELPAVNSVKAPLSDSQQAALEVHLTRAALLYARHARGGRIMSPTKMLNSHLNRTPQLLEPATVLDKLAKADDPANVLITLHPQHEQFRRLHNLYLQARSKSGSKFRVKASEALGVGQRDPRVALLRERLGLSAPVDDDASDVFDGKVEAAVKAFQIQAGITPADGSVDYDTARALTKRSNIPADKLRANMEMWRWMWDNLGDVYVIANVPEFMLTLKKDGETLYRERVVVGQTSKQTSIFTRTLKHIVLRPMWRVPESIKVRELWPSLKRGGGLMRQYGLQLETKQGQPVNWRKINWYQDDIRNYEVVQPPGRNSAMGKVKFSFPSQHTIFIHDTPDKYMFRSKRRAYSHGCLRLQNPVKLAEILLNIDQGWDEAHVDELIKSGPNRNAIKIETRIPMHLVYFTVWVDDDGTARSFSDLYGHEKRVRQALAGQWTKIAKGRNHLDAPQPVAVSATRAERSKKRASRPADYINRAITGNFF